MIVVGIWKARIVRATLLAKRRSRSSLVSNLAPFFPGLVRTADLATERLVRLTLLPELLALAVARFDCFFIRAKNTPIQK